MDRRCTQPDWDAAAEQFSLLFFLWLLSGKTGAENSQNLHQIVELISRIEGLLQSWSSTSLQVTSQCLRGNLPNICCLLKQKSHLTAHAWYPCVSKESSKRHRGTAPSDSARQSELRFTALPVLPAALEVRLETQLCHGEFCSFLVWY